MNIKEIEMGLKFNPKFDENGLMPVIASHADTAEILMLAYMNHAALDKTIATGEAYYYSRSRQEIWHKGATSGQVQKIVEIRTDCDQDAILLRILPQGDGGCCHVGYQSCFYRSITIGGAGSMQFNEVKKLK